LRNNRVKGALWGIASGFIECWGGQTKAAENAGLTEKKKRKGNETSDYPALLVVTLRYRRIKKHGNFKDHERERCLNKGEQ